MSSLQISPLKPKRVIYWNIVELPWLWNDRGSCTCMLSAPVELVYSCVDSRIHFIMSDPLFSSVSSTSIKKSQLSLQPQASSSAGFCISVLTYRTLWLPAPSLHKPVPRPESPGVGENSRRGGGWSCPSRCWFTITFPISMTMYRAFACTQGQIHPMVGRGKGREEGRKPTKASQVAKNGSQQERKSKRWTLTRHES